MPAGDIRGSRIGGVDVKRWDDTGYFTGILGYSFQLPAPATLSEIRREHEAELPSPDLEPCSLSIPSKAEV